MDRKGLIRESYRIEGISTAECRSIFLDWVLSLADRQDTGEAITAMLERHGSTEPDHPMTGVLREGLTNVPASGISPSGRRGGRRSRPRN